MAAPANMAKSPHRQHGAAEPLYARSSDMRHITIRVGPPVIRSEHAMLCVACFSMGPRGPPPRQTLCAAHRGSLRHIFAHYNGRRSMANHPCITTAQPRRRSRCCAAEPRHCGSCTQYGRQRILRALRAATALNMRHATRLSIEVEYAECNAKLNETCHGVRLRSPEPSFRNVPSLMASLLC